MRLNRLVTLMAGGLLATAFALPASAQRQPATSALSCANGVGSPSSPDRAKALQVVGLTSDNRLVCFVETDPSAARVIGSISGLSTDSSLVGIDYRVQNGLLYGVGNAGGLYTLDVSNASAIKIGQIGAVGPGAGTNLVGNSFGVDFNPAANALRIVSDTGQNLRIGFAATPPATNVDATLNNGVPPTPATVTGVTAAAYTNNDLALPTATTLFVINSTTDVVAIQSPANSGIVVNTGNLGVNASAVAGFDIHSTLRGETAVAVNNRALASLVVDGIAGLYDIDLLTGTATFRGKFAPGVSITDIAIPLNQL